MSGPLDIASLEKKEVLDFVNSFDIIISDVDGVLVRHPVPYIDGAVECIKILRSLGKIVYYLSNNCTKSMEIFHEGLKAFGGTPEDITYPTQAFIHYLKKINFQKEIFLIGSDILQKELEESGFKIADLGAATLSYNLKDNVKEFVDNEKVGAVIIDWDLNLNFSKLQKALLYLKRPDCIYIRGATDRKIPFGSDLILIGPRYFQEAVEDLSGRNPIPLAKPSREYNEFLLHKYNITDKSRVLFIGDSITEDMAFATNAGYKKLLVLTGITTLEDLNNWKHPEQYKPDFFINGLGQLKNVLNSFLKSNM